MTGLSFAFGFGNGYAVGVRLGVPIWIAPLVAPAVDLSVVALLASMQYLRANGRSERLRGPRLLLLFCGLVTLALNTAEPLLSTAYGRACFDAVGPLLLLGWSEVGPELLAALHSTVPETPVAAGPSPVVRHELPVELLVTARQLDAQYRTEHGRSISRDRLRTRLKVSNAVAGEVLRHVRATAKQEGGEQP